MNVAGKGLRGLTGRSEHKTKDQMPVAHSRRGHVGRMSRHRTATAHTAKQIWSEFIDGVGQELHGRAPMEAAHAVTAAVGMMD